MFEMSSIAMGKHTYNTQSRKRKISVFVVEVIHHQTRKYATTTATSQLKGDYNTYLSLLQTCDNLKALVEGKVVHAQIITTGFHQNLNLGTKLVSMYANCNSLVNARQVFYEMPKRDVFLWNTMIMGYASNGFSEEALELNDEMRRSGMQPDNFTFPYVLKACADLAALQQGKEIHNYIIRSGFESDIFVGNALVAMYSKCGSLMDAFQVFDKMFQRDVVSWNAMIVGYVQSRHYDEAFKLLLRMQQEGVEATSVTIASVLPACVHTKFGSIQDVRQLFDKMYEKNLVSWNAMIAGYTQTGHCCEALELFNQMELNSIKPDFVTFVSILPACASLAALQHGKEIHSHIIRCGLDSNVSVGNALIDMYAKCGSIEDARVLFDRMSQRNVISWTAMIAGYGFHGHGKDALILFHQMQQASTRPNHITFVGLLSACSHAGLVDEGWQYFNLMSQEYQIVPSIEHYACMVDLLGRAGRLDEAHCLLKEMSLEPNAIVWRALLGACKIHCNMKLGELVAKHLFELEPEYDGNYVLLSNIYASAGRWDNVEKLRTMMNDKGIRKKPGCSWIEIENRVHVFLSGDRMHPQSDKIYGMLKRLIAQMKEAGYVPDTKSVLHNLAEEEKELIICTHSEKLAIVFGLISTSLGAPIRITKNIRVCGDCHIAIKFISSIAQREIFVRDAIRFHHFKDGLCSCGDYW
eukprot:Gb_39725 [translate_table: standard]